MGRSKEMFMQLREEETQLQQGISFEHLIDAKKSNLKNAIEAITTEVSSGNYDSLKGLILALKGKTLFTDLEKALRPLANNDYLNKLEKGYSIHDVSIEQAATKTEYDYSVCNDSVYNRLVIVADAADAALKERQSFLKAINGKLTLVDEDTGEVATIYAPNKLQSDGLKITLK